MGSQVRQTYLWHQSPYGARSRCYHSDYDVDCLCLYVSRHDAIVQVKHLER